MSYETIVGLEIHVELSTKTKAFCSCENSFGGEPNTRVCPVCLALPGAMPVLNRNVLNYAVMAANALNCKINNKSKFDRKNYFYPDLTKGFQITQNDKPICENGYLEIEVGDQKKKIGIFRIQMEEDSGNIILNGKKVENKNPKQALREGIALISDDRKQEGLVLIRPVNENILMASPKNYTKKSIIDSKKEKEIVDEQIKKLNIKVSGQNQIVNNLSGGNQQKIVFAKALESNPDVMILNEPTRGVDIGAKSEIYDIINDLTKEGKSIILISTDLPEIIGISDRVIVMREGQIVKELSKEEANEEIILAYASGGVNG